METLRVSLDAMTTPPSLGVDSFLVVISAAVAIELLADSPLVAASPLLPS